MQNKNQYPENWADQIRPSILTRDGYRCTTCGVKHRQRQASSIANVWFNIATNEMEWYVSNGFKVKTIYLQVAHIDNNKSNCDPSNLIVKCPIHHLQMDSRYKSLMRIAKHVDPFSNSINQKPKKS